MIIPRQVHLASQVLPAGGAFTSQDFFDIPEGAKCLTFGTSYTRGSATGSPQYRVEWTNGTETYTGILVDGGSVDVSSPPDVSVDFGRGNYDGPVPADANPLLLTFPVTVPGGMTQVRLIVAEAGDTANPGTVELTIQGDGSG